MDSKPESKKKNETNEQKFRMKVSVFSIMIMFFMTRVLKNKDRSVYHIIIISFL